MNLQRPDETTRNLPLMGEEEPLPPEPLPTEEGHSRPFYKHIYFWVLIGVALGILVGILFPSTPAIPAANGMPAVKAQPGIAENLKPLGEGFISLIKMLIGPIVFLTVVAGIASVGDLRKVGRVGIKAFIYFELVTTFAMLIALAVVHLFKPGEGVNYTPSAAEVEKIAGYSEVAKEQSAVDFILHIIPKTFVGAFTSGDILQVLVIAILTGVALAHIGEKARPLTNAMQIASQVFFTIVGYVVWLAPIAAFGAMASTVGSAGVAALVALLKMMATFYLTCFFFVFVVLGLIAYFNGIHMWRYLRYIKEEILLVLGTSSSESALPPMMAKMERVGCAQNVVGIVLPSGYSFNLDGTSIYLAMAIVFLAQATNTPLSFSQEMGLLGLLLLTSKGAAAVTGGGFITLAATLSATNNTALVAGLALLIGIDRFMSEARAITNLIGNGLATLVIAKSEKELDPELAAPVLR